MAHTHSTRHPADSPTSRLRDGSVIALVASAAAALPAFAVTGSPVVAAVIALSILLCVGAATVMI